MNEKEKNGRQLNTQAVLIDGKQIAKLIQDEVRDEIHKLFEMYKRKPELVTVLVGDNAASVKYVQKKMEAAKYVGINGRTLKLPSTISEHYLMKTVEQLNDDVNVDGVLVQLPLPFHINERNICNAVDAPKDVDGFHFINMGKLSLNMDTFVPCTTLAVLELMKRLEIETFGKNVVICGRSKHIGLPLSIILHSDKQSALPGMEATVIICHRHTPPKELQTFTRNADIVITATGVINLITADMIKPGACVIDIGMNKVTLPGGKIKLVGDVDFEGVSKVAGYMTPVYGGVGPVTVAMLMKNTLKAAKNRMEK